jgi:hypothetical protein
VKHGKKFPREVINHWPEVFGEITLNVIPIKYLDRISLRFKNGKVWEINTRNKKENMDWATLEKNVKEIISSYEAEIDNIDFKLDTDQIKRDMIKASNRFLKKRKLL